MIQLPPKYPGWQERLKVCHDCDHHRDFMAGTITCGTFILGDVVKINNREIKLCGCVMDIKTQLEKSTCPLNKWPDAETENK